MTRGPRTFTLLSFFESCTYPKRKEPLAPTAFVEAEAGARRRHGGLARCRHHARKKLSCGFGRDLGASARSPTPPERVSFNPSQHLSTSRAQRGRLRRRSRARRAENSRGAVKKNERAIRASNTRSSPVRFASRRYVLCMASHIVLNVHRRSPLPRKML